MSTNQPVAYALKKVLADSYALYLKTQNYHWNVTGPHFRSLHLMFEEQYTELAAAIDVIAEHIRILGEKAPGSFEAFQTLSTLSDGDENADAGRMVRDIRDDQLALSRMLKDAVALAQRHHDEATIDLLIGRIRAHEKNAWMLSSFMNEEMMQASSKKMN